MNSNARGQEKRARRVATRPEPTIYGNCDSWSFIVGKFPPPYSRREGLQGELQGSNRIFIHNLSTVLSASVWDNMWAICGRAVVILKTSRIVIEPLFRYAPKGSRQAVILSKRRLGPGRVSGYSARLTGGWARIFFDRGPSGPAKTVNPDPAAGPWQAPAAPPRPPAGPPPGQRAGRTSR